MISKDFTWFVKNYKKLFNKYGSCFLAIKNAKVIGVYSSYVEGVKETQKTEKIGTFIIQQTGRDKSCYTNYISSMCF
ncbi:MAG: hypothetical protein MJ207_01330 [Bacilli bacterium]|nr:hypothetical protein [Bacilli bacterium]MCQ2794001.1 hypothetical protein [Bacilli bacterium]